MSYNPVLPKGQANMANSAPVVIASDQSPIPVTGSISIDASSLALASKQDTEIAQLTSILTKIIAAPATEATLSTIEATLTSIDFATQATLAAILAKIIAAPATEANQTNSLQKTQIVDAGGNNVTVTGNKLDVNASFSGDIEIGAVELKNGTDDTRATVTPANALKVDSSAVTQPISAASLPLPSGAATATKQDTGNTSLATIAGKDFATQTSLAALITANHTDLAAILTKLNGTISVATGLTQPLTDTQLRATPVPISGTVTVMGGGDASAAKQDIGNASLANIDSKLTNPLPISGTVSTGLSQPLTDTQLRASAVPISAASLPLPTGAATSVKQSDGSQKSQIVDGSGNVIGSTANALDINIKSGNPTTIASTIADGANVVEGTTTDAAVVTDANGTISGKLRGLVKLLSAWIGSLGQKTMANSAPVVIASDQTAVPISGTITITPSGTQDENIKQVNGATVNVGVGAAGTGTLRVATSTDSTIGTITNVVHVDDNSGSLTVDAVSLPLPTGASTAALQTQPGVDIGDVTINNTSGVSAVNIQDGGNSITVDGTVAIGAGSAVIGHVIADSGSTTAVTGNVTVVQGTGTNLHVAVDSGSITANAGTNLNTSLLALESGGNLASIKTDVDKIPSQGQAAMAASMPVVIASNQSAVPISGTVTVDTSLLATAAKQDSQTTLLTNIDAGIPAALGQTTMAASMPVTIASNQSAIPISGTVSLTGGGIDNTSLYNSTLSVTGAITGIDTTGYASVIAQIVGGWIGYIIFEGSNDNSTWDKLLVLNLNELSMQDVIFDGGIFQIKTSTKFIRLNLVQLQSGTVPIIIMGRTVSGIGGADLLSFAMEKGNNTPLYVEETATKKDISKALIPSDCPIPIYGSTSSLNGILGIIDTTGYQSISVELFGTWVGTVTFTVSNDGVQWSSIQQAIPSQNNNVVSNTANFNSIFVFPAAARYFRMQVTVYTSGVIQSVAYLRQLPMALGTYHVNLQSIDGVVLSANSLPVSSTVAVGGAAGATQPVIVSGVDSGVLVRRLLTDTSGRLIVNLNTASIDPSGTARSLGSLAAGGNRYGVNSLVVTEASDYEGQSMIEVMANILLELKINNQLLSELPSVLQTSNGRLDEPMLFRNEPSIFAN